MRKENFMPFLRAKQPILALMKYFLSFCLSLIMAVILLGNLGHAQYFAAIEQNDLEQFRQLIAEGYSLEQRDEAGATPLMMAATKNRYEMVKMLLEAGADVNAQMSGTVTGSAVMQLAAKYAGLETIDLLLQYEPNLERSLIALAYINRNDPELPAVVARLLEAGAPIDEMNHFYDALDDRAIVDYFPCLRHISQADYNGGSNSCAGKAAGVILAAFNADHMNNLRAEVSPEQHLRFAAMFAGPRLLEAVLADVLARGIPIDTPLLRAQGNRANPQAYSTALELALYKRNRGAVRVLLEHGADIQAVDVVIAQRAALDTQLAEILRAQGVDIVQLREDFLAENAVCQVEPYQKAMVSFILDDGDKKDLDVIHYIFAPREQVGTVALISNAIGKRNHTTLNEMQEVVNSLGWEVASHSRNHQDQTHLSSGELQASMAESKAMLELAGFAVPTFVYPYGGYNAEVLEQAALNYQAAFAGGYKLNDKRTNPLALQRYNISVRHRYSDYIRALNRAIAEGTWLVWAVHPAYDTGWQQQKNLAKLLDELCARGVPVLTVSDALARLKQ